LQHNARVAAFPAQLNHSPENDIVHEKDQAVVVSIGVGARLHRRRRRRQPRHQQAKAPQALVGEVEPQLMDVVLGHRLSVVLELGHYMLGGKLLAQGAPEVVESRVGEHRIPDVMSIRAAGLRDDPLQRRHEKVVESLHTEGLEPRRLRPTGRAGGQL
jgi:hypothetical protein